MQLKKCNKCKEWLLTTAFHKASREKDGLQSWCIACRKYHKPSEKKEYDRQRYHEKKDEWRDSFYKKTYGISLEQYTELHKQQNGKCAICGKVCSTGRNLAVDHCHTTGKVRGLLCSNCNQAIGKFEDSIDLLQKSIKYLEKYAVT